MSGAPDSVPAVIAPARPGTSAPRRVSFGGAADPADQVLLADIGEAAAATPERSLDLIYLDPPFATGTRRRGRRREGDAPLSYRDALSDPDELVAWLRPHLSRCHELLSPTGSLLVHLDHRTVHYVKVELDRLFGRARFVNEIVWCYAVGGKSRRRFARKHDTILWYGRTADYAFYPDAVRVPRRDKSHMRVVRDEHGREVQEKTDRRTGKVYRYPVAQGKVPEDWWTDIETLNRSDGERTGYPTQKPERLLERLILATTAVGDRVGDFFAGSGTTGAVCQRRGRGFVLSDHNPEAARVCADRLERQGKALATGASAPPDLVVGIPGRR